MPTGGDCALSPCGGATGAVHRGSPGGQDPHPHDRGATGRRLGKVKAVGAHRFVLSPVRGRDAAALDHRWRGSGGHR
jgi:hypothetical protein